MTGSKNEPDRAPRGRFGFVCPVGLIVAATFFTISLTPSLMPRDPVMQGVLSGGVAAVGYGVGLTFRLLWRFLEFWRPPPQLGTRLSFASLVVSVLIVIIGLSMAAGWQNASRTAVGLPPVETIYPIQVTTLALGTFAAIWLLSQLFRIAFAWFSARLARIATPPIAVVLGFALAVWVFWALIDGVLIRSAFQAADASFEAADLLIEPDIPQPQGSGKTGGPDSLVEWEEMGRWGRSFVATVPTRDEISEFHPVSAMEPVRVYVGRRSATTPEARAELALAELIRLGGFERSALVVAVPVGTGWMDPGAHDTVEFMLGGDVATVAVQYSYLTSVLSLMAHPEFGVAQARALFDTIYAHWLTLPAQDRPKLYVHGLSQGAFNSQMTLPLLDLLADPIDGALWAGSPFFSPYWRLVREGRHKDSPAWRPRYGNGSLVRTANQEGGLDQTEAAWGPMRLVFLNYASDPIVLFNPTMAFQRPDWLGAPRAFDVAPELRWVPVVTMFQVALDMMLSLQVERYGHYYIAPDYIDAWAVVVEPDGWSEARATELKRIFEARGPSF